MGVAADAARRWLDAERIAGHTANGSADPASSRTPVDSEVSSEAPPKQAHEAVQSARDGMSDRAAGQPEPRARDGSPASLPIIEVLARERDRFEQAILSRCLGSRVNGSGAARAWTTTNIAFPRLEAEAILLLLSEQGVCASAGAACSSGSLDPSPVLLAMGVPPELAHGSVRFSLSRFTTGQELDHAVERIAGAFTKLGRSSAAAIRE
ncbi:MAG: aminotransferase class V-fold PLP-dependent enzyme [Phycisphaerae bacterium]|nr:aminotransferase class V-fold PLP-dependent enzyme [Phycisphaerae bacterium]